MPTCPQCGGAVDERHAYCPHCGRSLKEQKPETSPRVREGGVASPTGSVPVRPATAAATARPITAPMIGLDEERTLLQRSRPVVEGIGLSFVMGLLYMVVSLNVAKAYVPILEFYKQTNGLIWPAILMLGAAWAGKDERENSFISGAVTGSISGLLLAFSEDSIHQWTTFSLRHTLGPMALGTGVGMVGATFSGVLGSPVMVRLPHRQKNIALLLFIVLIILTIFTISLPPEPASYFMQIGAVYYSKAHDLRDGTDYFHKDLLRLARRYFETAVERDPRLANAHNNLAVVLEELGDQEGALVRWRQAQILDLSLPEPYKNLGTVYLERGLRDNNPGLIEQAVEQYRRFLQLSPTMDPNALYNLALALYRLGDAEGALKTVEEAAQVAPDDSRVQALLQELSEAVQDSDGAPEPPPESPSPAAPGGTPAPPADAGAE